VVESREALAVITSLLVERLGPRLRGLYLFGSLASGSFQPGKSDIDLFAVVDSDIEARELDALELLHASFVSRYPEWHERVEVGYVSCAVLQSFATAPRGRVAVISPGEPLNVKDVGYEWALDWHDVCHGGETLVGPPPNELGPPITSRMLRHATEALLQEWTTAVRAPWVAYVPAHQGYIVVTVCRALNTLASGERVSKEDAVAWAVGEYPEWASFIEEALAVYRADRSEPHNATIRFVDYAATSARSSSD
jgi:predicted nucleotidyltransferase